MAAFLISLVGLSAGALGEGTAETSQEQNAAVSAMLAARRPELRPNFVAGEVIVKFKDAQIGGITAQSEDAAVRTDRANLLRLQSKFGVESRGPVFHRVHEQLRQGGLRIASGEAALRSQDLLRYYVLKTERDVQATCAS
jgi:hypothetical protein